MLDKSSQVIPSGKRLRNYGTSLFLMEKRTDSMAHGKQTQLLKVTIQFVDFPMQNGVSFHSHVKLPEGILGK